MQADFWHERWEKNQIGFHQDDINNHLQAFWDKLTLAPGSTVFVPLCGKSRDMLWLRAQGFPVRGVELSPIAVRDFFAENSLEPVVATQGRFECWEADGLAILRGDFFDLGPADIAACGGVFDRASLIALPPAMRQRYARHLQAILPPPVQTLLVTMEYPQHEKQGPPFAVSEAEVRQLYEGHYAVDCLFSTDILDENPGFRQQGVTQLTEKVYRLQPR